MCVEALRFGSGGGGDWLYNSEDVFGEMVNGHPGASEIKVNEPHQNERK